MSKRHGKPKKGKKNKHVLGECQCLRCKVAMMEKILLQDHNALVNVIEMLVKEKVIKIPQYAKAGNVRKLEEFVESEKNV